MCGPNSFQNDVFNIMFTDLNADAQKAFLKFAGLKCAAEGNFDVFPIAEFPAEDEECGCDECEGCGCDYPEDSEKDEQSNDKNNHKGYGGDVGHGGYHTYN